MTFEKPLEIPLTITISDDYFIKMFIESETFKRYDPEIHDLPVLLIVFVAQELEGRKMKVDDAKRVANIIKERKLVEA